MSYRKKGQQLQLSTKYNRAYAKRHYCLGKGHKFVRAPPNTAVSTGNCTYAGDDGNPPTGENLFHTLGHRAIQGIDFFQCSWKLAVIIVSTGH